MYQLIDLKKVPLYFSIVLVICLLLFWIQFKIRNPFWSLQPVNHRHQFWRKYQKCGVINPNFKIWKFLNFIDIQTIPWSDLDESKIKEFEKHIGINFLNRGDLKYQPSSEKHIIPYFNQDSNAYLSFYRKNNIILGAITNRTLRVHLGNSERFAVSYIDYLCVHRGNRKKRIAPELIQTHEYFQRTESNKKCLVSLFKKEGRLTNIIPLVRFKMNAFKINDITNDNSNYISSSNINQGLPSGVSLVKITKSNINLLYHFLDVIRKEFICFIIAPPETLLETINHNSIHIYTLVQNKEIISAFFFRETGTYSNSIKENLELFASLNNSIDDGVFIQGFYTALEKMKENFKHIYIEHTGHTHTLLKDIIYQKKKFPIFHSLCAYYLYNYNVNELKDPSQCCFLF